MDTSPEYIKLCEKAGEIQALRPQFITPNNFWEVKRGHWKKDGPPPIWLPRLDQLLEMAFHNNSPQCILTELEWFCKDAEYGAGFTIDGTVEQLTLAYLMKFSHNKTWNGEDWERVK